MLYIAGCVGTIYMNINPTSISVWLLFPEQEGIYLVSWEQRYSDHYSSDEWFWVYRTECLDTYISIVLLMAPPPQAIATTTDTLTCPRLWAADGIEGLGSSISWYSYYFQNSYGWALHTRLLSPSRIFLGISTSIKREWIGVKQASRENRRVAEGYCQSDSSNRLRFSFFFSL